MTNPRATRNSGTKAAHHAQPHLLIFLATMGLLGCGALLLGTLIAPFFVPDYNSVSDTISDLAAGDSEIIMDVALYGFAAGLLAIGLAAAHAHPGGAWWSVGVVSLAILAVLVVIVGARNEYGDGDNDGIVIHVYLVYGLGLLFTLMPLSLAPGLSARHGRATLALRLLAAAWVVSAPVFFVLPTSIDGLYERALGGIAVAMVVVLALVFLARGRQARTRSAA